MPRSLLTAGQSRWLLHILVGLLSIVAIASSAPQSAGGASMYSGSPGDIRGPVVILGSAGIGGVVVLRTASLVLPKPWRIYVDRLEFTFISMLWICWTSATMSFSAFTLSQGVCSSVISEIFLPTCPLLTFDLSLLHLLSTSTLALLLVVLSTALSPSYYLDLSTALSDGAVAAKTASGSDVFVMWELALADAPMGGYDVSSSSAKGSGVKSYGTVESTRIDVQSEDNGPSGPVENAVPVVRRDKFAEGRALSYFSLGLCSIGVVIATSVVLDSAVYRLSSAFIMAVGGASSLFAAAFLVLHRRQRGAKPDYDGSFILRHDRAMEVALAGALYLLWPLAAIIYTLFPPTPNRPCANPAASAAPTPPFPQDESGYICYLSSAAVALAWLGSWIILARVLGLIFPMPEMGGKLSPILSSGTGVADGQGENRSLLRSEQVRVERPQVQWGRMVAGEAFELGGDDDDEQEA
ncbi:hypothetical protein BCR39DRAFT_554474 [Naematelia encephala]|uniref:MARVEL domain-containing protein n=1 Tax=Naematelia encephala TaxID=71784 RepID=A0A1Y2AF57_9TREE|nr:hypothetical protein BCR39DRAFT_554474 [Naematelia encephala]